ncbi:sensor histidine kinase [Roseateles cellulosilyticus]|uniref:histidine kinase n=1 Tax=Pelomonas cellulosilytica TaxID=2906762 RepID=A0ABS8XW68_9BURK|nr:ATP-binding protein [Pelomonas sp. P8]MCE4555046.1 ATP-binding protein [Pelomonas sp. P8]
MLRRFWPDSLFTRMLLMQGVLVAVAALIFGLLLTAERTVLLAQPHAILWAPVVRQIAAMPVGTARMQAYGLTEGMRREAGPPSGLRVPANWAPGVRALRDALAPLGITLGTVYVQWGSSGLTYTSLMQVDGGAPFWLSASGNMLLPGWSIRMSAGLLAMLLLIVAISRRFVRRVTRPLARLHDRMVSSAQAGATLTPLAADDPWPPPPELRAMERAYSDLAGKLERNERERALLLAGVSHDLRSPLARIRLAAEMLPDTPQTADDVAAVTRNVDVADRLIASFLEFVRAGTQALDETVNAADVVSQAVAGFGRPPGELVAQVPERLLMYNASGLLLERLVVNLVDNALKHGALPVRVRLALHGDQVQLTVADAGPGLPAGGAERLIEAFARGDASRHLPGFGLGLTIIHQIVTRLRGRLQFEVNAASGHCAMVELPVSR